MARIDPTGLLLGAAGGAWTPDLDEARRQAARTLEQLDLSRAGTIVLWVPGTSSHDVPEAFRQAVEGIASLDGAQLGLVDYPATWQLRSSVATGYVALALVLDELRRRGRPGSHLLLAGESQGAWIIGELLTDPRYAPLVDRAALLGHPAPARTHYPDITKPAARASKAVEVNNRQDHVPDVPHAPPGVVLDAMQHFGTGDIVGSLPYMLRVLVSDPGYLIQTGVNALRGTVLTVFGDPHDYTSRMREAAELLAGSVRPAPQRSRAATG